MNLSLYMMVASKIESEHMKEIDGKNYELMTRTEKWNSPRKDGGFRSTKRKLQEGIELEGKSEQLNRACDML